MFCPQCGTQYEESALVCHECGAILPQHRAEPQPETPKGRLWVPFVILAVMLLLGVGIYLTGRGNDTAVYSGNPAFSITDGVLKYEPLLDMGGSAPTVPAVIGGTVITRIPESCFAGCTAITTVTLPDGLREIGANAFSGCSALRGLKLPEGTQAIEQRAFEYCNALEAVYIPASVTEIGQHAFAGCGSLRHVFYGGTLQQWEAEFGDVLPENCQLHIVTGGEHKDYFTP